MQLQTLAGASGHELVLQSLHKFIKDCLEMQDYCPFLMLRIQDSALVETAACRRAQQAKQADADRAAARRQQQEKQDEARRKAAAEAAAARAEAARMAAAKQAEAVKAAAVRAQQEQQAAVHRQQLQAQQRAQVIHKLVPCSLIMTSDVK